MWIGGHQEEESGGWQWSDASRWRFSNWGPGKPNNDPNQNHVAFNFGTPGTWNNVNFSQRRVSFASIKVKVSWQNNIYSHQNHSSVHIPSTLHIFIILYFNRNNCINHPSCTRAMWVVSIHLTLFIIIGHVMRHESYLDTSSHLTRSSRNLDTMVKTVAVQKTQFTFI